MAYTKWPLLAGVYKDDSPAAAEGHFIDCDKGRFVRDKWQTFGGWEKFATSAVTGYARGIHAWADVSKNPYLAVGTHLRLYAFDVDGNKNDITPVTSRGDLTSPFTTSAGSTTVTVAHTNHGLVEDQKVKFYNASAVGGITIDGEYTVNASPGTNDYTITHSSAASSSASGGGNVDYDYFLAPGNADGIGGLGYGTGGYGSGGYGSPATGLSLFPRTWSLDNWGQNLLANPRGGSIYEWAPNTAATELVTNGGFSTGGGGFTANGAGFSIGGGQAQGSVTSSGISQSITLSRGAWHLLKYNVTISAGSVWCAIGGTTIRTSSASERAKSVFYGNAGGAATITFTGGGFTGTIKNVSVAALATAHKLPAAPTVTNGIFVTPERRLAYLGALDGNNNHDPLRVGWTAAQDNQTFTASASNGVGSYPLSHGSRCVAGAVGGGENLIQTDTALYSMRYAYDLNITYTFDLIAQGCGLIGANARTMLSGVLYWQTPAGEYMIYAGGKPQELDSTMSRDVSDHLSWVQQDKIFAHQFTQYGEVMWNYPDSRDGNEVSRYALVNSKNQWAPGTFARTCWIDAGIFQYPIAVDTSGYVWYHEKGDTEDGGARSWSLESAYFDLADGNNHHAIMGAYPDHEDLVGGYQITVYTRHRSQSGIVDRTYGPHNVTSATGKISIRAVGHRAKIKWSATSAPTWYRQGVPAFDVVPTNRVR